LPLTLPILVANQWVTAWKPSGNRMMKRGFYHSPEWTAARNALTGRLGRILVEEDAAADIDLIAKDLSPRGRVDGLVEAFVTGEPRSHLVRPHGFGMEPPFRRMRVPHEGVVEMRTAETRTFGFFVRQDVFVALRLDLADCTHKHPERYVTYAGIVTRVISRMETSDKDETSPIDDLIGEFADD
jgi:hypothetical protein